MITNSQAATVYKAMDGFRIELPSWGFANTGTRFGKFLQPAAAMTVEDKINDAAEVHRLMGVCPSIALHVLWDLPGGPSDVSRIEELTAKCGIRPGSINPNLFEEQLYKYGSLGNPDPTIRAAAVSHLLDCVAIAKKLNSRDISLWFADGSNYPGTQNMRHRQQWFKEGLREVHKIVPPNHRLLIEYKPFEPAFYHTDIADWGMALLLARAAGERARVLIDTGHHYQAQNIEQIVSLLLAEGMLGGFHFNDRRYADDDLTFGSIDPYQVFRIFHEIMLYEWETEAPADIAYMVDQSHNLKGKIEAMIQTVCSAQELYAKASLVDHAQLDYHQRHCNLIAAEECLKTAFWTDVRPAVQEWRKTNGLPEDPLHAFHRSGYLDRITQERSTRNLRITTSYA
ncbi:MAG TPA: TIM barrel protein [Candidatus Dormibacteraeota bacterium]|nr:TIM barrel protein [Candidatus Dormibacteraeota bacterium]